MAFESPQLLQRNQFLEGIVRAGRVTKVDTNNRIVASVTYLDRKFQTAYLPVLQRNTVNCQDYYVPEVGERVWVLHIPGAIGRGLILGSTYTSTNTPPYNVQGNRGMVFKDGSYIIYDYSGHIYQVNLQGKYNLTCTQDATINTQATCRITAQQINLNGVLIDNTGNVTLPGGKTLKTDLLAPASAGSITATPKVVNADASGGGS